MAPVTSPANSRIAVRSPSTARGGERALDADFLRVDLGRDLPFADGAFDGVISSLGFHSVRVWGRVLCLRHVLRSDGWLILSVQHLRADFEEYDDARNSHETERVSAAWDPLGDP
ncbi:class I SAM-dependent methyltransferase [Natronorubrum sp. DTA28]|uniref:class I SAM-dependent methyltransferase n=1 Tax=Natronorubrum sp. DTA28 TaxID=3447019 RepID=UPI003F84D1D1